MPDHLEPAQLERYRLRTLEPRALLEADDHLAVCAACREKLAGDARVAEALEALRADLRAAMDAAGRDPAAGRGKTVRGWLLAAFAAAAAVALIWLGVGSMRRPAAEPRIAAPLPSPTAPAPGATRLALHDQGRVVTLDDRGQLRGVSGLGPDEERAVAQALAAQRIEVPAFVAELAGRPGTLLGGAARPRERFDLLNPVGTVVESTRPLFRWQALSGATSYAVAVFDANYVRVAASGPLHGLEWRPDAPLTRGREYVWQVNAHRDGAEVMAPSAPAPEARFRVLEQSEADRLERVRSATAGSHLVLGILYARAGLMEDARRELWELAAANPRSPEAQALLQDLDLRRPAR